MSHRGDKKEWTALVAAFLLFAAALLVVGPAEASRTTTDARSRLAASSSRELASLELPSLELVESSPRFGLGEDLGLLDPEAGPGGFVVFAAGTAQCELTYARNNPLKYVDPDGRAPSVATIIGMFFGMNTGGAQAMASMSPAAPIVAGGAAGGALLVAAAGGPAVVPIAKDALLSMMVAHPTATTAAVTTTEIAAGAVGAGGIGSSGWALHPRVAGQLADSRLGALAGKLSPEKVIELANQSGALRVLDANSKNLNINVIQKIGDVTLRITVANDKKLVISVGPIRPEQVLNKLADGRFVPLK